jgi:5-methyltetrahydrofolate--homocysteine methyltransferase
LRIVEQKHWLILEETKTASRFQTQFPGRSYLHHSKANHANFGTPVVHEQPIKPTDFPKLTLAKSLSIHDYFEPLRSDRPGGNEGISPATVTIGDRISLQRRQMYEFEDFTYSPCLHSLFFGTARVLPRFVSRLATTQMGNAAQDSQRVIEVFHQKYRSSRYSFGYRPCPTPLRPSEDIYTTGPSEVDRGAIDRETPPGAGTKHLENTGAYPQANCFVV